MSRVLVGSLWQSKKMRYCVKVKSIGFGFVVVRMAGAFGKFGNLKAFNGVITTKKAIRFNFREVTA